MKPIRRRASPISASRYLTSGANRAANRIGVYRLPKKPDEEVSRSGVKLTKLSKKQAE